GEIAAATFRITRTGLLDQSVSVRWDVLGDRLDFVNGVLRGDVATFLPGETSHDVQVFVVGDAQPEGNDGYMVNLSAPQGGIVASNEGRQADPAGGPVPDL
ncbi:MAG: hypothetical protein ACKOZV_08570, partial [Bacteroidota bacterium]